MNAPSPYSSQFAPETVANSRLDRVELNDLVTLTKSAPWKIIGDSDTLQHEIHNRKENLSISLWPIETQSHNKHSPLIGDLSCDRATNLPRQKLIDGVVTGGMATKERGSSQIG